MPHLLHCVALSWCCWLPLLLLWGNRVLSMSLLTPSSRAAPSLTSSSSHPVPERIAGGRSGRESYSAMAEGSLQEGGLVEFCEAADQNIHHFEHHSPCVRTRTIVVAISVPSGGEAFSAIGRGLCSIGFLVVGRNGRLAKANELPSFGRARRAPGLGPILVRPPIGARR